ncbi:Methyltransferase domain-containing protein [Asanoa hainanensis]|uniref:Methyltransferase domain-containing protein n=1 Tax=Asanoa hainanensis TaxID=560556 RepID=A0A239PBP9_9ACTN|nr:class I SAM-dependent methyltransferase [Asanoa hainanensis]SNT64500.1 Methyltransferase domain-containing protein [Asanoa hainanensis]
MTAPFDTVLRAAGAGATAPLTVVDARGRRRRLDPAEWCRTRIPGDEALLRDADGPVLDVGCGPGRLTAALAGRGCPVLGVDVSRAAVRLTRQRGGPALLRDVFDRLPLEGRWRRVVLADGNIGIGGDPVRLLRRCARLLLPAGVVLVELDPPGSVAWSGEVRLHTGDIRSQPLRWAYVGTDDIAAVAAAARLHTRSIWTEGGRWFASLTHP